MVDFFRMDSVIEIQRSHHEERERIIAAIVVENMEKKTSHREQVNRFSSNPDPPIRLVISLLSLTRTSEKFLEALQTLSL